MSVSGISGSTFYSAPSTQNSATQNAQQLFQQLGQSLQSGNLSAAQSVFPACRTSSRKVVPPPRRRATVRLLKPSANWARISNPATFPRRSRISPRSSRTSRIKPRKARPSQPSATTIITAAAADRVMSLSYSTNWTTRFNPVAAHPLQRSRRRP
jgi:hypothetical protein